MRLLLILSLLLLPLASQAQQSSEDGLLCATFVETPREERIPDWQTAIRDFLYSILVLGPARVNCATSEPKVLALDMAIELRCKDGEDFDTIMFEELQSMLHSCGIILMSVPHNPAE